MKSNRLGRLVAVGCVLVGSWLVTTAYRTWNYHHGRIDFPKIDRHVVALDWKGRPLRKVPRFDPELSTPFQVDLRARDVSQLSLAAAGGDVFGAAFDLATRWPPADRMPEGFDPEKILSVGKNPGLGVRQLHGEGITGRGVGIAIIDQILPTGHAEYAARLRLYEEAGDIGWPSNRADMHGAAVASIAVGASVGVAPEADLYYIATHDGTSRLGARVGRWWRDADKVEHDFAVLAGCVRRVLRINAQLPQERRIRVLALTTGWMPGNRGYDAIRAAVDEAKRSGLLVVSSSIESVHGFKFHGLGRDPSADPDEFASYGPGLFWAPQFFENPAGMTDRLMVPMDARTTAGFTRNSEYVYFRQGGWSWAIPYIAGVYALAAQVDPEVTPERFWSLALATGRVIAVERNGASYPLGPIIDPAALIHALRRE